MMDGRVLVEFAVLAEAVVFVFEEEEMLEL